MEKNQPTQTRPETSRTQRIEQFLLDPERVVFESIEEFQETVNELLDALQGVDLETLEKIQGADGVTPKRGKDYFTEEDIDSFERFIIDKMPKEGIDYPTKIQVAKDIREQVAKIPRVQGDKGDKGTPGAPGKDGSPDSAQDIVKKIRSIKKTNQALKITDVRGLKGALKSVLSLEDEFDQLRKEFEDIRFVVSPQDDTAGGGGGLTAEDVRDTIASAFNAGSHTGITFVHDDALNTYTLEVTGGGGGLTEEEIEDIVNGLVVGGTGITATYDDALNTLTLSLSGEEYTTAEKDKLAFISVTQAVDLDQMETDIATNAAGVAANLAALAGKANTSHSHAISDVTGLQTELDSKAETAADVGLGNVNNTSDANKPVSTAQQTALDLKMNEKLDGTPDTNLTANGAQTDTFNAGATIAAGEVVYMGTAGTWLLADGDASASAEKLIGIALEAGTAGNPLLVALPGSFVRDDAWAWTAGDTLYLSLTAGDLSATVAATGEDDVSRIIGYAVSADVIYLQPQQGVVRTA